MNKIKQGGGLSLLLALALLSPIATHAQTTVTRAVRDFELIAVDGNHLVVRGPEGTRELTVPPDFRFTVDGKSMAVSDLKAGMKGTAMVTTTTIEVPVYVTTVKQGTVVSQSGRSVVIRDEKGKNHRFTQSEVDARGIRVYMDDKPIFVSGLDPGDKISATIVSSGPPEILTVKEVDAVLAAADEAAPVAEDSGADESMSTAATAETAAAEPAPEPQAATEEAAPEAAAADTTSPFESLPKPYFKNPFFWLLVLVIVVAFIWVLARRKIKGPLQK